MIDVELKQLNIPIEYKNDF